MVIACSGALVPSQCHESSALRRHLACSCVHLRDAELPRHNCSWSPPVVCERCVNRVSASAGSCQLPVQTEQPTYQTCAVMGGAQLANSNLMNLAKAQFTFKPPNCSYSSEPCHSINGVTTSDSDM